MAWSAKTLFDRVKGRYRRSGRAERIGWIGVATIGAPLLLPIFLGYRIRRKGKTSGKTKRPFFVLPGAPLPLTVDPAAEAAIRAEPDTFALVRVIGNDLPPRHSASQSRQNLWFLLETEPAFPDCTKLWIVNRIVDPAEEAAIVALLEAHGQEYRRIPFSLADYAKAPLDVTAFPEGQYLHLAEFHDRPEVEQVRAVTQTLRFRNAYAMHNNGGRNAALDWGTARAKWVLPFDGNCLMTEADWALLRDGIAAQEGIRYAVVPMARLGSNDAALALMDPETAVEEPQVAFRRDAAARFDEAYPYGRRPKVELLARLDVRGPWDCWQLDPWDLRAGAIVPESRLVGRAGLVRRLASGRGDLETAGKSALHGRGDARNEAIVTTLRRLDGQVIADRGYDPARPVFYRRDAIEAIPDTIADALRDEVRAASGRGPYAVTDKPEPGPGGDLHDYHHPAPYWWPDPKSTNGLPYIRRDGERVSGTVLYEPESARFDRTRLQRLIDDAVTFALAHAALGDTDAGDRARVLIETWFLDPATAMTPHLRYAQIRQGHGNEGAATGLIEMKDLAYLLDAVRLLDDPALMPRLSDWLRAYRDWLTSSRQGRDERRAVNNHGVFYDLQLASIAAFLGDTDTLLDCYVASTVRLTGHFDEDGAQPHELARSQTQHYVAFNLHGWQSLAILYRSCGLPLEHQPEYARMAQGARWALSRRDEPWPFEQIAPFDADRLSPIALLGAELGHDTDPRAVDRSVARTKPRFHPHDGVPPWWPLMLTPETLDG